MATSGQLYYVDTNGTTSEIDESQTPANSGNTQFSASTQDVLNVGIDTANNLLFTVGQEVSGAAETGYYTLNAYNLATGQLQSSVRIASDATDVAGSLQVDPKTHQVYVGLSGSKDSTIEVVAVPYNPVTGVIATPSYNADSDTQSNASTYTLISSALDPSFNYAQEFALDQSTKNLYYTSANEQYRDAGATNGVYMISADARGQTTAVQLTNTSQFPSPTTDGNDNLTAGGAGLVIDLALDKADDKIFFTVKDSSGDGSIWYVTADGGANQTAHQLTGVSISGLNLTANSNGLTYDPNTRQLYVSNTSSTGGTGSTISAYQLNAAGTAVTNTTQYASSSNDTLLGLSFEALPVLATAPAGTVAQQNGAAVAVLSGDSATDADSGNLVTSATVTVRKGSTAEAGDLLSVDGATLQSTTGTTSTYTLTYDSQTFTITYDRSTSDATPDTLTITSPVGPNGVTATEADYAQLLSAVRYTDGYTDASAGGHPNRTVTFQVNDGAAGSPSGVNQSAVTVTVNRAPSATADTNAAVAGGAAVTGNVVTNDTDLDGDGKTVTGVAEGGTAGTVGQAFQGTYGDLTLIAGGSYTYQAGVTAAQQSAIAGVATGQRPSDVFTYTETDGQGGTSSSTLTIAVDRPPVAQPDTNAAVAGGAAVSGNVLTNDTDPDGDVKSVSAVSEGGTAGTVGQVFHGTYGDLTLNGTGFYTYQAGATAGQRSAIAGAAAGQHPSDVFTYTASDGQAGTSQSTLTVAVDRGPTVTPNPTAVTYQAGSGGVQLQTSGSLSDPDADNSFTQLTVTLTGGYSGDGDQLSLNGGTGSVTVDGNSYAVGYTGAGTGSEVLTITGAGTAANYQDVLDAVRFSSTATDPTNGGANATRTATYALTDAGGATGAASSPETITIQTAPRVTSVSATTSDGKTAVNYGQTVTIAVQFSQAVVLSGSDPSLQLDGSRTAQYSNQSQDGTTLLFTYTVGQTDNDSDLTLVSLQDVSGTIKNVSGTAADTSGADNKSLGIQVDTTAPSIAITTPIAGDNIVNAAEAAASFTVSGTTAGVEDGQTVTVQLVNTATNAAVTDTGTVSNGAWSVTVPASQALADGSYTVEADVSDKAGNPAPEATKPLTVDETAPSIASEAAAPTGEDLGIGKTVTFTVTTSEAVAQTGTSLSLSNGRTAAYASGSGTGTLVYSYTVAPGDSAGDLQATALNGTLQDGAGNTLNDSTFKAIHTKDQVDTVVPTVAGEGSASLSGSDIGAGRTMTFTVATSKPVTVTDGGDGLPTLQLDNEEVATYAGPTGTPVDSLTFSYTAQAGDDVPDLKATTFNPLPDGTTIRDAAGNDADLSGFAPIDTGVQVDTTAPAVSSPALTVAENAGPTPIGLAAPSDAGGSSLAIVAGALPGDGTVALANGTPIASGQALSAGDLTGLTFTPAAGVYGASSAFTYSVTDGAGNSSTGTATLAVGAPGVPAITGTVAGQATSNEAPVRPFASAAVSDPNGGATDSLVITLTGGGGTLADGPGQSGLTQTGANSYSLAAGTPDAVTAELQALMFTPAAGRPSQPNATRFTLTDASSAGTAASDASTTVTDTAAPADTVAIKAAPSYAGDDTFVLTGHASSSAGVSSVEISAVLDGGTREDLGTATVNANGDFT